MQLSEELLAGAIQAYCKSEENRNPPVGYKTLNANNVKRQFIESQHYTIKTFQRALRVTGFKKYRFKLSLALPRSSKLYIVKEQATFVPEVGRFVVNKYIKSISPGVFAQDQNILRCMIVKLIDLQCINTEIIHRLIKEYAKEQESKGIRISAGNIPTELNRNEYSFYIFMMAISLFGYKGFVLELSALHEASGKWIVVEAKSGENLEEEIKEQLVAELDEDQ